MPRSKKILVVDWVSRACAPIFNLFPLVMQQKIKAKVHFKLKKYFLPHKIQYLKSKNIDLNETFCFKIDPNPLISIIIPVYNNIQYTYACLKSIYNTATKSSYEIIIVDDCSTDNTQEVLQHIAGIRIKKNDQNSGFIVSCNSGAKLAKGQYLLFLNNDTQVLPNWLDELVNTFSLFPNVGLVGSKLIYPNGQLQEAGGIIWQDGSAWNFGRNMDPDLPQYNYLREVDYCSGAAIMIPKTLFEAAGCFDTRYLPAYCEDSDLALTLSQQGYKVLYQPLSQVIHFEGITSGTDTQKGVKSYQVKNTVELYSKWQNRFAKHRKNGEMPYFEKERNVQKRLLIIDSCTPTSDQDAGSVTAFFYIKILIALGYKITFMPLDNLFYQEKYTADLQRLGVECLYAPYITNIKSHLKEYGTYYDVVMIYRALCANASIDSVLKYCPQAKIIFNTADLHYLRLQRQAEIEKSLKLASLAQKIKNIEIRIMKNSDCTIVVSETEKEIILKEDNNINVSLIPLVLDIPKSKTDFANRKDILYLGGYQHKPNVDAVLYFVKEIWPLIQEQLPDLKFYILGSKAPESIKAIKSKNIEVIGFVPDLAEYFDYCRLSIAPLRYGAGIKGKIGISMSYGLPCVATSIAAEGMGLKDKEEILIANEPKQFTANLVELYTNQMLWNKLSTNGISFVEQNYSFDAGKKKVSALLEQIKGD